MGFEVYGMAFTKILRDKYAIDERGIFKKDDVDEKEESLEDDVIKKKEKALEDFLKSTSYFLCYSWGSMVSTLGRTHLQAMIDAVGEDFLYCDTDSVFYRKTEKSIKAMKALEKTLSKQRSECGLDIVRYDKNKKAHELGKIEPENECSFKTFGAKKYITIENGVLKCTIAGVPKEAGARLIKNADDFYLGKVFSGDEMNKLCLWYNDNENTKLIDGENEMIVKSNIAMLPITYILGLSNDFRKCLKIEGVEGFTDFEEVNINMNEDYI